MFTIQLRNLPESLYKAIKESAKSSKRSMTQEAIVLIEKGLENHSIRHKTKEEAYARLKEMATENPVKVDFKQVLEYIEEDRNR